MCRIADIDPACVGGLNCASRQTETGAAFRGRETSDGYLDKLLRTLYRARVQISRRSSP